MPIRRRPEAILVLVALLAFAAEIQSRFEVERGEGLSLVDAGWLIGDCVVYRAVVRGVCDRGTLDQSVTGFDRLRYLEGYRQNVTIASSTVSLTEDGRLVPKHPVLFVAALVPPYLVLREWGLLLFNLVQCVALVLIAYWLARAFSGEGASSIAALAFLATSNVRDLSYNVSPDCFGAVLVLGGVVLAWSDPPAGRTHLLGGALMGLSLWMRPTNLVVAVAFLPGVVASIRERALRRELALALAGFAAAASGFMLLNAAWFGDPLVTSYDRVVVMRDGVRALASHRDCMNRPILASIVPTLFDPRHGFLQSAPAWPLLLVAAPALLRANRERALAVLALAFAPVAFLVRYDFWDQTHHGNRFMLASAVVTSVAVAWVVERLRPPPG